jgi:hypothetical protein
MVGLMCKEAELQSLWLVERLHYRKKSEWSWLNRIWIGT